MFPRPSGGSSTGSVILAPGTSARNTVQATANASELTLKGFAGQTAPILLLIDSTGALIAAVSAAELITSLGPGFFSPSDPPSGGGGYIGTTFVPLGGQGVAQSWARGPAAAESIEFDVTPQNVSWLANVDDGVNTEANYQEMQNITGAPVITPMPVTAGYTAIAQAAWKAKITGTDANALGIGFVTTDMSSTIFAKVRSGQNVEVVKIVNAANSDLFTVDQLGDLFINGGFTVEGNVILDGATSQVVGGSLATAPASSHTATSAFGALTVGTPKQNTLGYDIAVTVRIPVTAATNGVVNVGVGPTSTPTVDPITATLSAVTTVDFTAIVPNNYYLSVTLTGTATLGAPVLVATPL